MALPGYCIGDLVEDADFLARQRAGDRSASRRRRRGITAVVGFIDFDPQRRNDNGTVRKYNAAAVVRDGRVLQRARKSLLPNYRYFDDKRYFAPGAAREPVDAAGRGGTRARVGVSICEDMWDDFYEIKPLPRARRAGRGGARSTSTPRPSTPASATSATPLIRRHVAELRTPLVYVNTVGRRRQRQEHHPVRRREPGLRRARPADRRSAGSSRRNCWSSISVRRAPHAAAELPEIDREREIYDALVMALRDYMRKTGFTPRRRRRSRAASTRRWRWRLPSTRSAPDSVSRLQPAVASTTPSTTRSIAERLSARPRRRATASSRFQDIDDEIQAVFEAHAHPIARSLTRENLHARIRGLLMMAESNDTGALLISCGNETEIALGYATLYGDMCGGISLIGDLSKIDVYRLARYVNRRHGREIDAGGDVHASSRRPSSPPTSSTRSTTASWRRSSASSSSAAAAPPSCSRLFERRALDPARFLPDAEGRTRLRQAHGGDLPRRRPRRLPAHAPLGLQAAAGPADPRRQRAGVRLRSARDDHQRLAGLSARAH